MTVAMRGADERDEVENRHQQAERRPRRARPGRTASTPVDDAGHEADQEVARDVAADGAVDAAKIRSQRGREPSGTKSRNPATQRGPSSSMKNVRKAIATRAEHRSRRPSSRRRRPAWRSRAPPRRRSPRSPSWARSTRPNSRSRNPKRPAAAVEVARSGRARTRRTRSSRFTSGGTSRNPSPANTTAAGRTRP